jgi:uncharacterized phiE125 gp8 family phage protein
VPDYSYNMRRTADPTIEPVTQAEAQLWCKQDDDTDDDVFNSLIVGARDWVEQYTGRALIEQTWTQIIDWRFPRIITLPHPPLSSITSLGYTDSAGNAQTLTEDTDFIASTNQEPAVLYEAWTKTWPSTRYVREAITVTYVAGYGDERSDVPDAFRIAMRQLILHWYDARSPVVIGTISKTLELTLTALLNPYKVFRF